MRLVSARGDTGAESDGLTRGARYDPRASAAFAGYEYFTSRSVESGWRTMSLYPAFSWVGQHFLPLLVLSLGANLVAAATLILSSWVTRRIYRPIRALRQTLKSARPIRSPGASLEIPQCQEILQEVDRVKEEQNSEQRLKTELNARLRTLFSVASACIVTRVLLDESVNAEVLELARSLAIDDEDSFQVTLIHVFQKESESVESVGTLVSNFFPKLLDIGPRSGDPSSQREFVWDRHENAFLAAMAGQDRRAFLEATESFAVDIQETGLDDSNPRFYCKLLLDGLSRELSQRGADAFELGRIMEQKLDALGTNFSYVGQFTLWLAGAFVGSGRSCLGRTSSHSIHIKRAVQLIHQSYYQNIGL